MKYMNEYLQKSSCLIWRDGSIIIVLNILKYKFAWQGKQLIKVDKWYPSSQICHDCGFKNEETKDLSIREWECPKCGSIHNRDKNAAINIREEARRMIA